jgi:membrane-associated protein
MIETLLTMVEDLATSPWIFPILFAFAALDAFFPVVPSESVLVTAGVFAASGDPNLVLIIAAAALGALVGDHISYLTGRVAGPRVLKLFPEGTRRRATLDRTERVLHERGGSLLVVARYIPGGRTATTLTMGVTNFPLWRFSSAALLAAVSWGVYVALLGFVGGAAFEDDPFWGLVLGFGLAVGLTLLFELVRMWLRRRRAVAESAPVAAMASNPPRD